MDVLAYARVIRRQWIVVIVGLAVAQALALLAVVRVSGDGLEYRSPPIYAARSTLLVTQEGFPWGRSGLTERRDGVDVPVFADPGRMEYLASLYSELARNSRAVVAQIERGGKLPQGAYNVAPVTAPDGRALPIIEVIGLSESPADAVIFSNRVAEGLRRYIHLNQEASDTAPTDRIQLPVQTRASAAEVFQGVKLTRPLLIFLLGSIVTLVVAFTRDNMQRPGTPGTGGGEVEKLEATHRVAPVEDHTPPRHAWSQRQAADRSSG
jgi:hypothetical protein